eukprot:scaffold41488_cov244-Skeletonema_dohrnii-CCMP3373.AAC.1
MEHRIKLLAQSGIYCFCLQLQVTLESFGRVFSGVETDRRAKGQGCLWPLAAAMKECVDLFGW